MKRIFAVILVLVMALSLCACGETEASVGDQMYEKYGALIDKLEAGDYDAASDSFFSMMPEGEKYSSVVGKLKAEDYEGAIAEITEMMPVPPETVVEITPENFWDYYELTYSEPHTEKDAQGNIKQIFFDHAYFELKEECSNIDFSRSSIEVGYTGDCRCKKIESIDWSTGELTLGSEYCDDIVQSLVPWLDYSVSDTEKGAKDILLKLSNCPHGPLCISNSTIIEGGVSSEDNLDNAYFFTLENVQIVRAEGTLVILNS